MDFKKYKYFYKYTIYNINSLIIIHSVLKKQHLQKDICDGFSLLFTARMAHSYQHYDGITSI